jgi:L-alanine-DL-glutamate epimerase-like enolase superfamily enzyme
MKAEKIGESVLNHVRTFSSPSDLKITDMRFASICGAPFESTLIKICTNQDIVGFGEVRDFASKTYALMLRRLLINENPCNIDKIFRRIKQFGGHARQGGGVSGVEVALWDIAGKAYGIPVYQMLGGKFRDKVRLYCDTDAYGKKTGKLMGEALKMRLAKGYTFLKMDLGIDILLDEPGTLNGPIGVIDEIRRHPDMPKFKRGQDFESQCLERKIYDLYNIPHFRTGIHVTEKGLDLLEKYISEVRSVVGYEVPLAVDHFGHFSVEDAVRLLHRLERYSLAWAEDLVPWQLTHQYSRLAQATSVPLCTGEDIYLKEGFEPLLQAGGVSIVHPDVLTCGGIMEMKKIGDLAQDYGVAMAVHNAESPVACLAAVHAIASTENFIALEHHAADVEWWSELVCGPRKPIVENGYIEVPKLPGLGIESLNDELIARHIDARMPGLWEPSNSWDSDWSHDRLWS